MGGQKPYLTLPTTWLRPRSVVVKPSLAVGSGSMVGVGVGEPPGDAEVVGAADGEAAGLEDPLAVDVGPAEGEAVGEAVAEGVGVAGRGVGGDSLGPGVSSEAHEYAACVVFAKYR